MRSFLNRISKAELTYKLHLFGLLLAITTVVVAASSPASLAPQQVLLFASSLAFAGGFAVWCEPVVRRVWEHPIARILVIVPHLVVLIIAAAIARNVVSLALGLPPQDFDLTVGFFTLAFYIPAWSLVVSILVGAVAMVLYLLALLVGIFTRPFSATAKLFGQAAGALAICFYAANIFDFANNHQESLHPIIRWVALFADYQAAHSYPGIGTKERVRLHENGVISYADVRNNEVIIRVRKLEQ